jgi:hypothetical protein
MTLSLYQQLISCLYITTFLTSLLTLPDVGASLMYSSIVATKEGGGCLLKERT